MSDTTRVHPGSLMLALGARFMCNVGVSEEDIAREIAKTDAAFPPPLHSQKLDTRTIQCPLFTTIVASRPSDSYQKVQHKNANPPLMKNVNHFIHTGAQRPTEITISHNGGLGGPEEELFQHSTPVKSILREAQDLLNQVTISAPCIMHY